MKIAVLSRNGNLYSTKRLIEAIEQKGHEAILIDYLDCAIVTDMAGAKIYYGGKDLGEIDAIIPRIGASYTAYGSAVVRQFEMMGKIVVNSSLSIVRSRDKLRATQIFARQGVQIPKTVFANHPKNIELLINEVGGAPLVIKLLEGTQGIGVVLAESKKAAKSVIEAFYGIDADILIQEFIKEANGADIRAFVVNGKVVGAMKRQGVEGEFRSNLHRGGTSMAIKLKKSEKETAIAAAKAMGLSVAGVDMLPSNRGPLVLEVNSSPGLEGIEKATGVDIAGAVISYIEELAKKRPIRDTVGV
ncbi:MAG TPA: 30S ribosomal protein S6--L-glutamate ligase [Luteibaculaceae bacterium]|nr:30S ribosomal protein S6--L-glutamate ligase [Luteibaculaceae bacterium]